VTAGPKSGFSLMEVLLAISILLACLVVLGQMATVGRRHAEDAESLTAAQLLCQAKLNEILVGAVPVASRASSAVPEMPEWSCEVEVQTLPQYDLVAVRVTVSPTLAEDGARRRGKQFSLLRWMHAPAASARSLSAPSPSATDNPDLPAPLDNWLDDQAKRGEVPFQPSTLRAVPATWAWPLFPAVFVFRKRRRAAFTLLEMLVAAALCGVLLMGLWTLYSTYANLFERGQARVERSQLCRSLMQQIADDLQSAIQDPIAGLPDRSSGEAQRRRFGLAGTSSELRMDILQITPRQGNPAPVGATAGQPEDPTEARVPELRTVYYTFSPPGAAFDAEATAAPSGLIRRELDFETPLNAIEPSAAADAEPSVGVDTDLAAPSPTPDSGSPTAAPTAAPTAVDDRWTWVPEVVSLEFRYFDGSRWSSSWNSLLRGSLPVAVEVRVALGDPLAAAPIEAEMQDLDANMEPDAYLESDANPNPDAAQRPVVSSAVTNVQMIVDLPLSPEYRKPQAAESTAQRSPQRSTARRIVPRRWTSPGASTQRPEDWLRTSKP